MSIALIPESAPFDEAQREWLNGFFSGLLGLTEGEGARAMAVAAAGLAGTAFPEGAGGSEAVPFGAAGATSGEDAEEEEFPWHDPALSIEERMELAESKPPARRFMAAMAQLDCGACGYVCQSYGEAIASGQETNLGLCSPGGRATGRMLKQLVKEIGHPKTNGQAKGGVNGRVPAAGVPAAATGAGTTPWSRQHPFPARLIESRRLSGPGSAKEVRHVAIDLADSGLRYKVGDALGIWPTNCDQLVDDVLAALAADGEAEVTTAAGERKRLRAVLRDDCCLKEATEELIELLAMATRDPVEAAGLRGLLEDEAAWEAADVLDVLQRSRSAIVTADAVVATLQPIAPRLYSIASSQRVFPQQVHLTCGTVTWEAGGRRRKGVASTLLADRLEVGGEVRVFVQPSHGFGVPADREAPMIMVGPGTGIAPFMAFLQERRATQSPGRNWLFFGDQHEATDFLYREPLEAMRAEGLLTRLDTAFSRDQKEKIYVQDRMRQHAAELYRWLCEGAHFYVCGDAARMAGDVDRALQEIVAEQGNLSDEQAKGMVAELVRTRRYQRDVY